jgi:hypothetical protein
MPYDYRDHIRETNKAITHFQREVGVTILWFEFDRADTSVDDVYDEGSAAGGRRWFPPKRVPVYSLIRQEAEERPDAEGFYAPDTIHFSALIEQLRKAGLSNPTDARSHLLDRVLWDGEIWNIQGYQIQGRLHGIETTLGIDAVQVSPEEMVNDPDFAAYAR